MTNVKYLKKFNAVSQWDFTLSAPFDEPDAFTHVYHEGSLTFEIGLDTSFLATSLRIFDGGLRMVNVDFAPTPEIDLTSSGFLSDAIIPLMARKDVVRGSTRPDVLEGFGGNDSLFGNGGNDTIDGGRGSDRMFGKAGDDLLLGGRGNDLMSGGAGVDTVSYAGINKRVKVSLANTAAQDTLGAGIDRLVAVENLIGTWRNDRLGGNDQDNRIEGGDGRDHIYGGAGDDVIIGGLGGDTTTGGKGSDTFVFASDPFLTSTTDSRLSGGNFDRITDFRSGTDKIDLTGFDPDGVAGNGADSFTFIGVDPNLSAGLQATDLYFNSALGALFGGVVNGDPRLYVELTGVTSISASDLIL